VKHWLPHDARAKTFATRVSALERFMARYPGKVAIVPQLSLVDGLQAGRWLLQQPMRIHQRCEVASGAARVSLRVGRGHQGLRVKPEHDWSSHTADAFRYLALVVKHAESTTRKASLPSRQSRRATIRRGPWTSSLRTTRQTSTDGGGSRWPSPDPPHRTSQTPS
jgi:hypothetical protein